MDVLRLIADCSMYSDGVWPCHGNFLKLFSIGLNKHAPPSPLLFVKSGIAEFGAIKRAELQKGAVVKVVEIAILCREVLIVLAVGGALWRLGLPE